MDTRILKLDPQRFSPSDLDPAAQSLREGGLVAFPTETVYGIGVDLGKPESVRRLLEIRESPAEKHITLHIASREDVRRHVAGPIPVAAQRLMRRFWPGPLTLVFPVGGATVGLRMPDHPIAAELIRRADVPVGAPSANLSSRAPAVDAEGVRQAFEGKIEFLIDGGACRHRVASTVVQIEGRRARILREGAIPRSLIEETNACTILFVCTGNTCRSPMAERLLKSMLAAKLGLPADELRPAGYRILSAGTAAGLGSAPFDEAAVAVGELGGDLSGHRSQPVSISMAEDADRIYVMTKSHRLVLEEWMPDLTDRIELLDPAGQDVSDPFGTSLETYRATARRIQECLERRLAEILSERER